MTKRWLIKKVRKRGLTKKQATIAVEAVLKAVNKGLDKHDKVLLTSSSGRCIIAMRL
jgi:nucleoid DNA-binding protein